MDQLGLCVGNPREMTWRVMSSEKLNLPKQLLQLKLTGLQIKMIH